MIFYENLRKGLGCTYHYWESDLIYVTEHGLRFQIFNDITTEFLDLTSGEI